MLHDVAREIREVHHVEVFPLVKDLSVSQSSYEIHEFVQSRQLEVFGLVNNAGFGVFGNFAETDLETELSMAGVHVLTPIALTKLFLRDMLKRNEGEIINVASLAGFQPGPMMSIYYSTKAFLISFTEAVARENKDSNVRVSVLCPGVVDTNFRKNVSADSEAKINSMNSNPREVVACGIRKMRKGIVVILPSLSCQILAFLSRILPRSLACDIVYKIQLKNRG